MATPVFEKETWLDITVNIIPLGLIFFFVALYAVASPWAISGLTSALGFAILFAPLAVLAYLTFLAAEILESAEAE